MGGYQGYVSPVINSKPNQLHTHNKQSSRISSRCAEPPGPPVASPCYQQSNSLSSASQNPFSSFIPRLAIPAALHHIGRCVNPGTPLRKILIGRSNVPSSTREPYCWVLCSRYPGMPRCVWRWRWCLTLFSFLVSVLVGSRWVRVGSQGLHFCPRPLILPARLVSLPQIEAGLLTLEESSSFSSLFSTFFFFFVLDSGRMVIHHPSFHH